MLEVASSSAKANEGKGLLTGTMQLLSATWKWASVSKVSSSDEDSCKVYTYYLQAILFTSRKDLLSGMLSSILVAYSRFINAALAQRTLEEEFPRLRLRSAIPQTWKEDDDIIADAQVSDKVFQVPILLISRQ